MKTFLTVIIVAIVLFGAGFFIGMNAYIKGNIATIDIINQSDRAIMTATVNHEKGSAIAANIKPHRKQHVRFYSKGPNRYSLTITFDSNKTIYSESDRAIKNGEIITETVHDSTVAASRRSH